MHIKSIQIDLFLKNIESCILNAKVLRILKARAIEPKRFGIFIIGNRQA